MESSVQFICVFCGSLSDEYGCPCSTCKLCGNDAHYSYDCPLQVPFVYNQDPCFNQNLDNFPQTSPSFPQQYLCCEDCEGPHATFECQRMNQNLYNSFGFDQFKPPQYSVVHQPPQETNMEMLQARENLMEAIQALLKKYNQIPSEEKCIALFQAEQKFLKVKQAFEEDPNPPEIIQELLLQLIHDLQRLDEILPKQAEEKGINKHVQEKQEEKSVAKLLAEEQAARINSLYQNPNLLQSLIYQDDDDNDDDYDEESLISMNTDTFETPSPDAIMTSSPIEEPKDSLIMKDEDINTIPEKESDEDNESSAKNLVQNPSESEATSDNESEPLFDSYADTTSSEYSSDDESILEEDVFSNLPFKFDVESISSDVYPIYDEELEDIDGTNYLINSIINFTPKIDPLLEEFAGELALINPIPPGIDEVDFDPEGDIRLVEKLSYDNSSPRPPEELNSEDIFKFFSAFPIPVEGSDFLLEDTNTMLSHLDDSLPELETFSFDIEEKNSDSTTTHFDYSLPIYEKFSFHDDPMEKKNSGSTIIHAEISLPEYESFRDKSDSVSEMFDDYSKKGVQDHSKQGRKVSPIDQDLDISLAQHDAEIQGRLEQDMEFDLDFSIGKEVSTAEKDISLAEPVYTAGATFTTNSVAVSTASPTRTTRVSTVDDITMAETLVYIRKSAAKDKASSFNVEEWEDTQARIEANEELAQRLQAEEIEKYTKAEQARMLEELINRRKSHTRQQLRGYSFDEIKALLGTTMRRVNTFVPIESEVDKAVPELAGESLKRDAEEEFNQESSKR
ncbi:hypothetical protein Tco_0507795 [Tanacetum coccineum]